MTQAEIREARKRIAEFEGINITVRHVTIPKYDTDWNDLRRVWEKFRDLKFDKVDESLPVRWEHQKYCSKITRELSYGTPLSTFAVLNNAIKWYNDLKK